MRGAIIGLLLLPALSTGAKSAVLFEDNFDDPTISQSWTVRQSFNGWSATEGAGIEVQTNRAVSGTTAHSGDQYIELDSDTSRGGIDGKATNSKMSRLFEYGSGSYKLEFYYLPRTNKIGDNGIDVWLNAGTSQNIGGVDGLRRNFEDWALQSYTFDIPTGQPSWELSLSAGGTSNEYGGFIDSLSLYRVPGNTQAIPAPATLVLMFFGLIWTCLFGWYRRPRGSNAS